MNVYKPVALLRCDILRYLFIQYAFIINYFGEGCIFLIFSTIKK